jgi:hypothetical protein
VARIYSCIHPYDTLHATLQQSIILTFFVMMLAQQKMLGQTEINHFELGLWFDGRKQKIFELQIAVNDTFGMQIAHGRQHLLDEARTLRFGIVIIGLFVETIEQIAPVAEFLDNIDFVGAFVDFVNPHNVGMIELTHDEDFVAQLTETFGTVNETNVEAFDGVLDARGAVRHETDHARHARPQDGTVVDAFVDFFNRFAKWSL